MSGSGSDFDCVVVGAGISGIVASRLVEAGFSVMVCDKGVVLGDVLHLAESRAPFDRGAQFLTRRSVEFSKLVEDC